MTHRLERTTTLRLPLAQVFAFFQDPRNLAAITPPWLSFSIRNPGAIKMKQGAEIDYLIRWAGIPIKWKTIIIAYDAPHSFVDEQARGPYAYWHHEHTFRETADGVVIHDRVNYRLPLGILGDIAHALLVRRQLNGIFDYRESAMRRLLPAP